MEEHSSTPHKVLRLGTDEGAEIWAKVMKGDGERLELYVFIVFLGDGSAHFRRFNSICLGVVDGSY